MKISLHMNLSELAEHMGDATEGEARYMRCLLVVSGYKNTEEIPDNYWSNMLVNVVNTKYR